MNGMFHSAAVRLTGWYIAIIMSLSIGCSFALYQVSSNDLYQNTRRQFPFFTELLTPGDYRDFARLRQDQLEQARNHLKANLLLFNAMVLLVGGAVSYLLARKTLEPIEESLTAQKRFTADASHELRTPLTAMQSEIEVALRDKSLTKNEAVHLLRSNLEEVAKLKALSEGLLHLAQGSGKLIQKNLLSTSAVTKEAVKRVQKQAEEKKISFEDKTNETLLKGDFQALVELIVIFLDNAIKYSSPGSKIIISSKLQNKYAKISVRDKGIGIKAKDMPHIFERFYRADNSRTKDKNGGYGLGLAIAKKFAEAHEGYIDVHSISGKGSTFTISIPSA